MSSYVEKYRKLEDHASALESRAEDYKARADEDRWEQCRLAHEAVESGEFSRASFADAVGKSSKTVQYQYRMWDKFGHARSRPTYWEAQAEVRNHSTGEERTREIARDGVRRLPTQDKAEAVRELLEDEDVATAVAADPKVRSSFAKATDNVMDQTRERQRDTAPEIADHEDDLAVLNTLRTLTRFRRDLRDAMDDLKAERLSDEDREALEDAAERTAAALGLFATTVRSEEWDRALAQLVEGGDA